MSLCSLFRLFVGREGKKSATINFVNHTPTLGPLHHSLFYFSLLLTCPTILVLSRACHEVMDWCKTTVGGRGGGGGSGGGATTVM